MTQPTWPPSGIGAMALTDLLGRWPTADGPLYRLLATRIARLADTGELPAGLRLPAERDLAAALSVSRNTVAAAYQVLRDEGMAESRQGAGTRIVPHRTTPAAVHRANGFFAGLLSEATVEADLSLAAVDCAPWVAAALTDPETLLDRAERDALTRTSGYFPHGLPDLRTAIASHLTERLTLPASPGPGDRHHRRPAGPGPADPDRGPARPAGRGRRPHLPWDPRRPAPGGRRGDRDAGFGSGQGLDPDRLEHVVRTHRPALVYLIPTYQNPTGLVMPAGSRHRVAAIAAAHPGHAVRRRHDAGRTAAARRAAASRRRSPHSVPASPTWSASGSLSKLYWGGLRTGWIRGSGGLIARLAAAKAAADQGSAAFGQAIVAALLRGQHEDIVKWRGEWLRARYDALAGALRASLPDWTWPEPDGGLCLWARLPGAADSGAFAQAALRHGVAVVPGRLLSASTEASSFVRLAFIQPPDVLRSAVRRLAAIPAPSR